MSKILLNYSFLIRSICGLGVIILLLTGISFPHSTNTQITWKDGLFTKAIIWTLPAMSCAPQLNPVFTHNITSNLYSPQEGKLFITKISKNIFRESAKTGESPNSTEADLIIDKAAFLNYLNSFTYINHIYSFFINHFLEAIAASTVYTSLRHT
jgi:hypothetical protein